MAGTFQLYRSNVAARRPANGSRKPGELYLNMADAKLGYIDSAGVPHDLGGGGGLLPFKKRDGTSISLVVT